MAYDGSFVLYDVIFFIGIIKNFTAAFADF